MIMSNFLKTRKSVRDFKRKKISDEKLDEVRKILQEIVKEEDLKEKIEFRLYENGDYIYYNLQGVSGYAGVMIESPHYIAIDLKDEDEKTKIFEGYYSEKLVTELNQIGIETCWITVNDIDETVKKRTFGDFSNNISYILAIGHSKARNPFLQEPFSERLGLEDIIYDRTLGKHLDIDDLERRGLGDIFFYIRFAPSTKNLQPWRFIIEDDKVELYIKYIEGEELLLVDAGIIMYYFETLAQYLGIRNKWVLGDGDLEFKGGKYRYIGEFHL